jgi:hypothetical protein
MAYLECKVCGATDDDKTGCQHPNEPAKGCMRYIRQLQSNQTRQFHLYKGVKYSTRELSELIGLKTHTITRHVREVKIQLGLGIYDVLDVTPIFEDFGSVKKRAEHKDARKPRKKKEPDIQTEEQLRADALLRVDWMLHMKHPKLFAKPKQRKPKWQYGIIAEHGLW